MKDFEVFDTAERENMKTQISKYILMIGLTAACVFSSACAGGGRKADEPEEVVELFNNDWVMEKYMDAVQDYDHVINEQVYFDFGGRSIGPTEYRYRGIVYLTDEEAERLWNEYDWEQADDVQFEFGKMETDFIGDGPWYSSQQFNKDNYSTVNVNYTVFDGKKLVFDISQT